MPQTSTLWIESTQSTHTDASSHLGCTSEQCTCLQPVLPALPALTSQPAAAHLHIQRGPAHGRPCQAHDHAGRAGLVEAVLREGRLRTTHTHGVLKQWGPRCVQPQCAKAFSGACLCQDAQGARKLGPQQWDTRAVAVPHLAKVRLQRLLVDHDGLTGE